MTKKKLYFLFNPVAGKKIINKRLANIINEFVKEDYEITIRTTQSGEDAVEQAAYACGRDYTYLIIAGGDGTLSQCLQGVMRSETRLPIGYIPSGSTNDFAQSLGIPSDQISAARAIIQGEPVKCDIGGFNDTYFTYVVAFGLFTNITYDTPQYIKNLFGHSAYMAKAARELDKLKSIHMRVEYDDNVIEDDLLIGMVTNTASAGGVLKVKNFMLDDGVFEVMLVKKPKNPAEIGGIVKALLTNDMTNKNISFFRTSRLKVTNLSGAPVPWTRDGEYGGSAEVNEICCYKRAVEFVLCGKEDLPFEKS